MFALSFSPPQDLKPANVLLESGTNKAMLADFGLAKNNRQTVTRGVGTPAFMPPEMLNDEMDPAKTNMLAVDIYAIAVILWQLWFKQVPYSGKGVHQIITFVMRGKRPSLTGAVKGNGTTDDADQTAGRPDTPQALSDLIEACWRQEASERPTITEVYATFKDEVVPAVEALSKGAPALPSSKAGGAAAAELLVDSATMWEFLEAPGLQRFAAPLAALGITDVEMLSDREICDDDTLTQKVGMTKTDIRKLRLLIESTGTGPTMMMNKKKKEEETHVSKETKNDTAGKAGFTSASPDGLNKTTKMPASELSRNRLGTTI